MLPVSSNQPQGFNIREGSRQRGWHGWGRRRWRKIGVLAGTMFILNQRYLHQLQASIETGFSYLAHQAQTLPPCINYGLGADLDRRGLEC